MWQSTVLAVAVEDGSDMADVEGMRMPSLFGPSGCSRRATMAHLGRVGTDVIVWKQDSRNFVDGHVTM